MMKWVLNEAAWTRCRDKVKPWWNTAKYWHLHHPHNKHTQSLLDQPYTSTIGLFNRFSMHDEPLCNTPFVHVERPMPWVNKCTADFKIDHHSLQFTWLYKLFLLTYTHTTPTNIFARTFIFFIPLFNKVLKLYFALVMLSLLVYRSRYPGYMTLLRLWILFIYRSHIEFYCIGCF